MATQRVFVFGCEADNRVLAGWITLRIDHVVNEDQFAKVDFIHIFAPACPYRSIALRELRFGGSHDQIVKRPSDSKKFFLKFAIEGGINCGT